MPKQRMCVSRKLDLYVKEFGSETFTTDGKVLTCKLCDKAVNTEKKYYVKQHVDSAGHKNRSKRLTRTCQSTSLLTNFLHLSNKESEYYMDLCQMMVEANIPLFKVQHPSVRSFLHKYCKQQPPHHTTLRKTYLGKLYDSSLQRIRHAVGGNPIWVSIDETTDVKGQYVVNTIIGALSLETHSTAFLIESEIVERTNHATIAQAFTKSKSLLWPEGVQHDKVLLFVTDAAPYMKKAAKGLKVLFPKMVHFTCLAHEVHRICEEIRVSFPDVDHLVANVKKFFVKAPFRVRVFRDLFLATDSPLPPQPVVTCWGTWLSAALYYASHFEIIERVVAELDGNEAAAIKKSQDLLKDAFLRSHLTCIASNFSKIPDYLKKLECSSQTMSTTLGILDDLRHDLDAASDPVVDRIRNKLASDLHKNPGLERMLQIHQALLGNTMSPEISNLSLSDISSYKYAPLVSVDVERSFSRYNDLLTDRRYNLTPENVRLHIIPMCNADCFE